MDAFRSTLFGVLTSEGWRESWKPFPTVMRSL